MNGSSKHGMDEHLAQALDICGQDGEGWIDLAQIALMQMVRKCNPPELIGAAKLWLDGGHECIARHAEDPKRFIGLLNRGNSMIRVAVDYLAAAGDNEGLIALGKQQEPTNLRLALRAWASIGGDHRWIAQERDVVLRLAETLRAQVEAPEDVKRICDAYACLGDKTEMHAFAEELKRCGHPVWSRIAQLRFEETDISAETELSVEN